MSISHCTNTNPPKPGTTHQPGLSVFPLRRTLTPSTLFHTKGSLNHTLATNCGQQCLCSHLSPHLLRWILLSKQEEAHSSVFSDGASNCQMCVFCSLSKLVWEDLQLPRKLPGWTPWQRHVHLRGECPVCPLSLIQTPSLCVRILFAPEQLTLVPSGPPSAAMAPRGVV